MQRRERVKLSLLLTAGVCAAAVALLIRLSL